MGSEAQVKSAEQRLKPFLTEKVCQWICRMAEKLNMVRIFLWKRTRRTSEGTGLKLEHEETCVPSNDGVSDVE